MEYSRIRRQNTGSMGCIPPKTKGGEIFLFYTDDPKKQGIVNICTKLIL